MLVAIEPMIATVDQLIDDQLSDAAPLKRRIRPWLRVLLVALLLFWGPFVLLVALAAR